MRAIIVGGGIGGLASALFLHSRDISCVVYEQAESIRELGVGINTLPHAIAELAGIGLLPALDQVAIRTDVLYYLNRFGQEVWSEKRGLHAGHLAPQFSIHRGRLQAALRDAVIDRLGAGAIRVGRRLTAFTQDETCARAFFADVSGRHVETAEADALIGADGIHSTVRRALFPKEGPPCWNGLMLWRGATQWPRFLTGESMIVAGGMAGKIVVYPIAGGERPDLRLTNWAMLRRIGEGGPPPRREDWSRPGRREDVEPFLSRFRIPQVDVAGLVAATPVFYEYPMCDRDPLPFWTLGRVTLLGDAAHPMYPVGSNGASQAVLDARCLADRLAACEHPRAGLAAYASERAPKTAEIVHANRKGGPEGVIDAVEALAPEGFSSIEPVLGYGERLAIVRGYAAKAGFAAPTRR